MKVVIVGGDGWVSRTAIEYYVEKQSRPIKDICVYGSTSRMSKPIAGVRHMVEAWIPKPESFRVETFIPAAFLTLDKCLDQGEASFRNRNLELIKDACKYIEINAPKKCILFSSGIVSLSDPQFYHKSPKAIYRELKKEEEDRVLEACMKSQTKLIVCRMFNASGRYVTNPNSYALSNFLYQGMLLRRIIVDNEGAIWRRYSDLGQIVEVCDRIPIDREYILFESGGVVVELHELARKIADVLGIRYSEPLVYRKSAESYLSKSNIFESLAESMKIKLLGIEDQIWKTKEGVEDYIRGDI